MPVCSFLGARKSLTSPDAAKIALPHSDHWRNYANWHVPYWELTSGSLLIVPPARISTEPQRDDVDH